MCSAAAFGAAPDRFVVADGSCVRGGADAAAEPELADAEAEWWSFHSYNPETLRRIAQTNRGWALGCEERLQAIHTPSLLLLGDPDPDRAGPLPSYVRPASTASTDKPTTRGFRSPAPAADQVASTARAGT